MTTEQELTETISAAKVFFDATNKFIPKWMADHILQQHKFITFRDNDDTYYFNKQEGLWLEADKHIDSITQACLGIKSKKIYKTETLGYIKTETQTKREDVQMPLHLVPMKNGLYNTETQELEEFNDQYFFTSKIPVEHDPEAECPETDQFLREILETNAEVESIYELIGYCLHREYSIQTAFMLTGQGSNGKSVLIELIRTFLGKDNCSSIPLQQFSNNRFAGSILYGKLANLEADLPASALKDTGLFRKATGGDMISGEQKFKEIFQFYNHAKLIFSANTLPETKDDTYAFFRRWVILKFNKTFIKGEPGTDPHKIRKITTEKELSGLFNVSITKLGKLLENGVFSGSKKIEEYRLEYIRKSDSVSAFIHDCLEKDKEGWIKKELVFDAYVVYTENNDLDLKERSPFFKAFKDKAYFAKTERKKIDGLRPMVFKGLKFKESLQEKTTEEDVMGVKGVKANPLSKVILSQNCNKKEMSLDTVDTVDTNIDKNLIDFEQENGGFDDNEF